MKTNSIRFKIMRDTSVLLGASLAAALAVVTMMQLRAADENGAKLELDIRDTLNFQGNLLAGEHAGALVGPFEDNSFTAVQDLILRAVQENDDVVYGVVVDPDLTIWAIADNDRLNAQPKGDDKLVINQLGINEEFLEAESGRRELKFKGKEVIEFSAKVEVDEEILGSVRYGLSTARMIAKVEAAQDKSESDLSNLLMVLVVIGGVLFGIGAVVSGRLAHQIAYPLQDMVDKVRDIAEGEGDLTARVHAETRDEIGELAGWINEFLGKLQELIRGVGDTTMSLADASGNLTETSEAMSGSASTTSQQATRVTEAAEQVSASTNNAAAAVEEIQVSITEIARNAHSAAEVASSGVHAVESANDTVEKLGTSSADIGKIINVITSIAEQTNLLALNATIEAARAGDAGKGFAVVASEVKDLAKETAKATEDISGRIAAIQNDATDAVEAIGKISTVINEISALQSSIAAAVEEQSATMGVMAESVHQTASASDNIVQNIKVVAGAAGATMQGAGQAQGASEELREVSFRMSNLIERFKYE